MSRLRVAASRLAGLFGRGRRERELEEEFRFHLEMQAEENAAAGMCRKEARDAALRSFGGVDAIKEEYRERRAIALVETTWQDIRYAVRTLGRSPGYTLTAVATLALAIGANTAMFSVLNAVLFHPLPYQAPERLAMLWSESPGQKTREGRAAYGSAEEWKRQSQSFEDMAIFDPASVTLDRAEGAERISVTRTTANLFPLLGVRALHGRTFTIEEAERKERVAVISHRFWQRHFGGSFEAIGATISLDGASRRIVGVMPETEHGADVWEPQTAFPEWETQRGVRGTGPWFVIGRMRLGVTVERAQEEMNAIASRLGALGISVVPLSEQRTSTSTKTALWLLTGAVLCVLLIAATNVASLTMARSANREREMGIRAAIGASRARIARQLLVESVTLAVVSGAIGLWVAHAAIRLIVAMQPAGLESIREASLGLQTLAWALGLCVLTGVLVGASPAITAAQIRLKPAAGGIRRALVVTEFALAVVLLAGAGLLIRSLLRVQSVDPGFRHERVLSMQMSTAALRGDAQRAGFYNRVLEQVAAVPGVESASILSDLFVGGNAERTVTVEGEARIATERLRFRSDEATPEVFQTLGTSLRRGRSFTAADGPNAPRVAIVNEAMARRLWPGSEAVGKRFRRGDGAPWITVVGVMSDMRRQGPEREPIPQMFEPLAQNPGRLATLLVRTRTEDPMRMAAAVEAAVRREDKQVPLYGVSTVEAQLGRYATQRTFQTALLAGFSAVGLLLAAIGIYGLIQYSITTRTREIGIRMAVGAQAGEIFRMVIGEGLKLSLAGLVLGIVGALWLGRAVSSLLFGVSASDPLTFAVAPAVLIAVAVVACYFPARRAMKVEPVVALRMQ